MRVIKRAVAGLGIRAPELERGQPYCRGRRGLGDRPRRRLDCRAGAVGAVLVATVALLVAASSASATVTEVEAGTYLSATAVTSITPTLSTASTAGELLVAIVATTANTTVTAPTGWIKATSVYTAGVGTTQIWYYANNPGAISSVKFTLSASDNAAAQLSEWSGVETTSPLDATGATGTTGSTKTQTIGATAAAANELAIASFGAGTGSTGNTFTVGSGWTNLMAAHTVSDTADYKIGVGSGSVSETETAATAAKWAAAIATFFGSCGGGSLGVTGPTAAAFGSTGLQGANQHVATSLNFTPTDSTGSGSGWNITGTSTTFTNASSKTLPTSATTVTAGSVAATAATCRLPANAISYPVALPAGTTAPTAVKLYDSAAGTGLGGATVTLTFNISVPPNAYSGVYSSTWTFSIVSGP